MRSAEPVVPPEISANIIEVVPAVDLLSREVLIIDCGVELA
jgi:hypothetical protein